MPSTRSSAAERSTAVTATRALDTGAGCDAVGQQAVTGIMHDTRLVVVDRRSARCAAGVLAFMATLPLQWQALASTNLGTLRWFHIGAIVMLVLARPADVVAPWRVARLFPSALAVTTALLLLTGIAYGGGVDGPIWIDSVQQAGYVGAAMYAAAAIATAIRSSLGRRILVWSGPVSLVVFVSVFAAAVRDAGVDVEIVFARALTGDPSVLLAGLYRVSFSAGQDVEVLSNARHDIYVALLVATFLSGLAFVGAGKMGQSAAALAALGAFTLAIASLSRSVMLAIVLMFAIVLIRAVSRSFLNFSTLLAVGLTMTAAVLVGPVVLPLLYARVVTDTASYDTRIAAFGDFFPGEVAARLLGGGGQLEISTHTMVSDAALRGSWVAGCAAIVIVWVFLRHFFRAWSSYQTDRSVRDLSAIGAGCLLLVRAFTTGGGYLNIAVWMAFGIVLVAEISRTLGRSPSSEAGNGVR